MQVVNIHFDMIINYFHKISITMLACSLYYFGQSQPSPARDENIPYLVTFGHDSEKLWGIVKDERNTSLEIQFIKNKTKLIRNNNVVLIVQNQYGVSLPFFVIPIGGVPVYKPSLRMKPVEKK